MYTLNVAVNKCNTIIRILALSSRSTLSSSTPPTSVPPPPSSAHTPARRRRPSRHARPAHHTRRRALPRASYPPTCPRPAVSIAWRSHRENGNAPREVDPSFLFDECVRNPLAILREEVLHVGPSHALASIPGRREPVPQLSRGGHGRPVSGEVLVRPGGPAAEVQRVICARSSGGEYRQEGRGTYRARRRRCAPRGAHASARHPSPGRRTTRASPRRAVAAACPSGSRPRHGCLWRWVSTQLGASRARCVHQAAGVRGTRCTRPCVRDASACGSARSRRTDVPRPGAPALTSAPPPWALTEGGGARGRRSRARRGAGGAQGARRTRGRAGCGRSGSRQGPRRSCVVGV
jgi:hypothetical protein